MPVVPSTIAGLRSLLAARFPEKLRRPDGFVSTGVPAVDGVLGGGLPVGRLTELVSAAPSAGGQLIFIRLLVTTRAARLRVALVDGADGFAPEAAPADALRHLLWVRGRSVMEALTAGDLLVRDGNHAVVALDLRGLSERALRRHPAAAWYRLQRAAEGSPGAVLVQTPFPLIPAVPWRLVLRSPGSLTESGLLQDELIARIEVETARGHADASEEQAG